MTRTRPLPIDYAAAMTRREAQWRAALPHIGALLERVTGTAWADVLDPGNHDRDAYAAQLALIWLLHAHDLTPAVIARLLGRHHSSIVHAEARIGIGVHVGAPAPDRMPAAIVDAAETARQVQALLDAEVLPPSDPAATLRYGALDRTLCKVDPAVAQYVNWTLLDRHVVAYVHALPVLGLHVGDRGLRNAHAVYHLATRPAMRRDVVHALERAGLAAHAERIRSHAEAFGYPWSDERTEG